MPRPSAAARTGAVLLAGITAAWCQLPLCFHHEKVIIIPVAIDTVEVNGIYWFLNTGADSVTTRIYYPFPVDSAASYPTCISVRRYGSKTAIPFSRQTAGCEWIQTQPPSGMDSIQVIYRQKTGRGQGTYIVTTTRNWNKPLEWAEFTVTAPRTRVVDFVSFEADTIFLRNDSTVYRVFFRSFKGEQDILVRWR